MKAIHMKKAHTYLEHCMKNSDYWTLVLNIKRAQEEAIKEMVIRCALNAKPVDENDIPTLPMSVIHDIAQKLIKEID